MFKMAKANLEWFVPATVSETSPEVPDDKTDLVLKFKADIKLSPNNFSLLMLISSIIFIPLNFVPTKQESTKTAKWCAFISVKKISNSEIFIQSPLPHSLLPSAGIQ